MNHVKVKEVVNLHRRGLSDELPSTPKTATEVQKKEDGIESEISV